MTPENAQNQLTFLIADLKNVLDYNPETSIFTWKKPNSNKLKAGDIAGWDDGRGYLRIKYDGIVFKLHQLAWLWVYGEWELLDHIDKNRSNNAISNLRPTTPSKNAQNQDARWTNRLGVKGVQERHGRYRAYITFEYKTYHLGTYDTIEEAVCARENAERKFFET